MKLLNDKLFLKKEKGFTLVELLVVMAILGILVALVAGNFRTAQVRGRDAERKSDLRQLANSLELFYADHGSYPPANPSGVIEACPYDPITSTGTSCSWGTSEFTDGKTVYFKTMPEDPVNNATYLYRTVSGSSNQMFQLFARLENLEDPEVITTSHSCGSVGTCNHAVTSTNTSPDEN